MIDRIARVPRVHEKTRFLRVQLLSIENTLYSIDILADTGTHRDKAAKGHGNSRPRVRAALADTRDTVANEA